MTSATSRQLVTTSLGSAAVPVDRCDPASSESTTVGGCGQRIAPRPELLDQAWLDVLGAGTSRIVVKPLPSADHSLHVASGSPVARAEVLDLLVNYVTGFALEASSLAARHTRSTV